MGRVHHLRRQEPHGRPAPAERPRAAVEAEVLRRRQRELGLRRQHAAGVLRRPVPALRDLRAATSATTSIFKIACGPNGDDYDWTEVLMRDRAGRRPMMHGLALHYYCGTGSKSRSATQFDGDRLVLRSCSSALRMEELVTRHAKIMDKYDPQKRVAMIVDEWGTWHAVEPGTNPGFLYQQNTLRDALVARPDAQHLQQPLRPRADGQHRPDRQRAAGDDPDRRRRRCS